MRAFARSLALAMLWSTPAMAASHTLQVDTAPVAGVPITVAPADATGQADGVSGFARTFPAGTSVSLSAPATAEGKKFLHWNINNGETFVSSRSIDLVVDRPFSAVAEYGSLYYVWTGGGGLSGTGWGDAIGNVSRVPRDITSNVEAYTEVRIAPGTYNEGNWYSRVVLSAETYARGNTHWRFAGYSGPDEAGRPCPAPEGPCQLNCGSYAFDLAVGFASGLVVLDGVNLYSPAAPLVCIRDGDTSVSVIIRDSELIDAGSTNALAQLLGQGRTSRSIWLDGVTFSSTAGRWVEIRSADRVRLSNCQGSSTASLTDMYAGLISLGYASGDFFNEAILEGNVFSCGSYSSARALIECGVGASGKSIYMRGNAINSRVHGVWIKGSNAIGPWPDLKSARLYAVENSFELTPSGFGKDVVGIIVGNNDAWDSSTADGDDDPYLTRAEGPTLIGNHFTLLGERSGHSAGINLMRGCMGGLLLYNQVSGPGVSQGIYLNGDYATAAFNTAIGPDALIFEESKGNNAFNNTLYSEYGGASNTVLMFRDGRNNAIQPVNNVCMANVVVGAGASNCTYGFSAHSGAMAVDSNILDRNLYWITGTGSGGLGNIDSVQSGGGSRNPPVLIDWSPYRLGSQYNDLNSTVGDPLLADPGSGDLRATQGSPACGHTSGSCLLASWNDRGAWQVRGVAGPDSDGDSIQDDGDRSGMAGDHPCAGGQTTGCDDNCPVTANTAQQDADADGVGDACDLCPAQADTTQSDADHDGVGDACDACPATVPGAIVDAAGCPPLMPCDADRDGDVDDADCLVFQSCAAGPQLPLSSQCGRWDLDLDADVDQSDYGIFQRWFRR